MSCPTAAVEAQPAAAAIMLSKVKPAQPVAVAASPSSGSPSSQQQLFSSLEVPTAYSLSSTCTVVQL